jgi:hypothetical protein
MHENELLIDDHEGILLPYESSIPSGTFKVIKEAEDGDSYIQLTASHKLYPGDNFESLKKYDYRLSLLWITKDQRGFSYWVHGFSDSMDFDLAIDAYENCGAFTAIRMFFSEVKGMRSNARETLQVGSRAYFSRENTLPEWLGSVKFTQNIRDQGC